MGLSPVQPVGMFQARCTGTYWLLRHSEAGAGFSIR
jgi:hypothetical protein